MHDSSKIRRIAVASLLVSLALFFVAILRHPIYSSSPNPFPPKTNVNPPIPIEMTPVEMSATKATLKLDGTGGAKILNEADWVSLSLATYGRSAAISRIKIIDLVSQAVLFEAVNLTHEDNQAIRLFRVNRDRPGIEYSGSKFSILAETSPGARLAVWARDVNITESSSTGEIMRPNSYPNLSLIGYWVTDMAPSGISRLDSLEYIWDGVPVKASLISAGLLLLFSAYFLAKGSRHFQFFACLIFFCISIIYGVVTPPFQAPDEPDHFLKFAEIKNSQQLVSSALALARRGHLESIKSNPEVFFSKEYQEKPSTSYWDANIAATGDLAVRSPVASKVWPLLAGLINTTSAAQTLIILRLLNILVLTLGFLVFIRSIPSHLQALGLGLVLTIPTLPFFGMHWSNHNFIIAVALAGSGLFLRGLVGSRLRLKEFFIWGLLSGLAFISGVTGIVLWLFFSVVVALFLMTSYKASFALLAASIFSLSADLVIFSCATESYWGRPLQILNQILDLSGIMGKWFQLPVLLILGQTIFMLVTALGAFLRGRVKSWHRIVSLLSTQKFAMVCLGIWIYWLFRTALMPTSFLPNIEYTNHGLTSLQYGLKTIKVFAKTVGFGVSDWYLSQTFWGGFGWLETMPPQWFIRLMRLWPTIGITMILVLGVRGFSRRSLQWLLALSAPLIMYVFLLAASSMRLPANLHGRYMIGFYLMFLGVTWLGFIDLHRLVGARSKRKMEIFISSLAILTHFYCWHHLLGRYFGPISL